MIGYKVTNRYLQSVTMANNILGIQYQINKWVSAKPKAIALGYGLTYFASLKEAIQFGGRSSSHIIFKCEIKNPIRLRFKLRKSIFSFAYIKSFLVLYEQLKTLPGVSEWPDGTKMAESIKLISEITEQEKLDA